MTKIFGTWCSHDASYCLLQDGWPTRHDEFERFLREKEPPGDAIKLAAEQLGWDELVSCEHFVTCAPWTNLTKWASESYRKLVGLVGPRWMSSFKIVGHHQAHAAHAFYSSGFQDSLVVTLDGGGVEADGTETACTAWIGKGTQLDHSVTVPLARFNVGGLWTRATRYIFKMQSGWPLGHQAGTVMSMAAFGDPSRFRRDFTRMLTVDLFAATHKPPNQPKGAYTGNDPVHPYLDKYGKIAQQSEQDAFDLAAGLQAATEDYVRDALEGIMNLSEARPTNLCIAGGVALNCSMTEKIWKWFPFLENVYVPPVPYDGGLCIGAAQYVQHHVLGVPVPSAISNKERCFPFALGKTYDRAAIDAAIERFSDSVIVEACDDIRAIDMLADKKIVSVYGQGSESGRRALGNRSILADPRDPEMKDKLNQRVKHRQSHRPYAPTVLRENVNEWFERDADSPYMSFALKFREDQKNRVPSVVHTDGTGRAQTVKKEDCPWLHSFLSLWKEKSGVPVLILTSYNDREPVVEDPNHAFDCFLRTEIDAVYFYDHGLLVTKR